MLRYRASCMRIPQSLSIPSRTGNYDVPRALVEYLVLLHTTAFPADDRSGLEHTVEQFDSSHESPAHSLPRPELYPHGIDG